MAIFKCKICGGTLEITSGETVATCEYCGTKQTLPKLDDEKKANLFDRANHFRRNNDFDKAMGIYEQILNEDTEDAESYWSIVLCRYGIEYVEDPSSRKRVPTVNRAQFTSVFDDEDYKSAIKYADAHQKELYEKEATAINEIQKGILAISGQEEPFDVFICYKETDANGRRTQDSVLATELYHELTREGYKVFFSRITLEDKLGTAYEPYIFAALNSSKVMVVLGTRPEYFNAVWVRNEWSRYLALIKQGQKKMLIPAYRDMDPYDLPEEFSHLQAQDMSKLGFMQDLVRGIKKIVEIEPKVVKETVFNSNSNSNIAPLLKRAFMFLEDGEFERADDFFEQILNQNPETAQAYVGKLMVEKRVKKREELANCSETFENNSYYVKAAKFGDKALCDELINYNNSIIERKRLVKLEESYSKAVSLMQEDNVDAYDEATRIFKTIPGYKDAYMLIDECNKKSEIVSKNVRYTKACNLFETALIWNNKETFSGTAIGGYEDALQIFESLENWKDSAEKAIACRRKIQEIRQQIEEDKLQKAREKEIERIAKEKIIKRNKKVVVVVVPIFIVIIVVFAVFLNKVLIPNSKYTAAIKLINEEKYDEAITALELLDGYKDSNQKIVEARNELQYQDALYYYDKENYAIAKLFFQKVENFKDSSEYIRICQKKISETSLEDVIEIFSSIQYNDSTQEVIDILGKPTKETPREYTKLDGTGSIKKTSLYYWNGYHLADIAGSLNFDFKGNSTSSELYNMEWKSTDLKFFDANDILVEYISSILGSPTGESFLETDDEIFVYYTYWGDYRLAARKTDTTFGRSIYHNSEE